MSRINVYEEPGKAHSKNYVRFCSLSLIMAGPGGSDQHSIVTKGTGKEL